PVGVPGRADPAQVVRPGVQPDGRADRARAHLNVSAGVKPTERAPWACLASAPLLLLLSVPPVTATLPFSLTKITQFAFDCGIALPYPDTRWRDIRQTPTLSPHG